MGKLSQKVPGRDDVAKVPRNQCLRVCGMMLFGLVAVGGLSGSSWYMNYQSAATSLEHLGFDFMEKVPLYLGQSLKHRLDPIRIHLTQGLKFLHAKQANVTTWSGIKMARFYSATFLLSFFEDAKCCFGIFSNMGLGKGEVTVEGGWQQWLNNHQNDMGSDKAIFDVVLLDKDETGSTTVTSLRNEFTTGNETNRIESVRMNLDTLQETGQPAVGDFLNWPALDGHTKGINPNSGWWRAIHIHDMLPGEFRFGPVFVWTVTKPYCLKIHGIVPLYQRTELPTEAQLAQIKAGTLDWGPRVGAWVVGFKLWFLSSYLASLELKGGSMYLVERVSGVVIASSDPSYVTLRDRGAESPLPYSAQDNPNRHIKSASAVVAPDGDWTQVKDAKPVEVELEGRPHFVQAFSFVFHGLSLVGVYTVPRTNILAELNEKANETAATSIIVNITFCGAMLAGLFCWGVRRAGQLYQADRAQKKAVEKRLVKAAGASVTCRFSMVLVNLQDFRKHGRLLSHETVSERGELLWLHDHQTAEEFLDDYISIFFSHQWLGWEDPDPCVVQYPLMVETAQQVAEAHGRPVEDVWIWVDYVSIPMANEHIKLLAVETLHVYVSLCEVFIIVAPSCTHSNTKEHCGSESYFTRGWCRLEQYTRITAWNGVRDVYLCANQGDMQQVCNSHLNEALSVMDGKFGCCQRGHPKGMKCDKECIIDTMLGLYICASQCRDTMDSGWIWQLVQRDRMSIYPDRLFGSLTHVADNMINEGMLQDVQHVLPENNIVAQETLAKRRSTKKCVDPSVVGKALSAS